MRQTEMIRWPDWPNLQTLLGGWGSYHIREEEGEVCVDIDLPGAQRENISLSSEDGGLRIRASRDSDGSEEIHRHIPLGDIDTQSLRASLENGVLEIRAKKRESGQEIEIS